MKGNGSNLAFERRTIPAPRAREANEEKEYTKRYKAKIDLARAMPT